MNKERLLRLARRLDRVKPERFSISNWVGSDWEGEKDLSCGTTACAFGWATTIPEFQRAGLKLVKDPDERAAFVSFSGEGGNRHPRNHTDVLHNATVFFNLTAGQTFDLFWPSSYGVHFNQVTAQMVAKKIRKMVKNHT